MCLAIPARIIERTGSWATVDIEGNTREVGLMLTPEAKPGDYVLIHAGFSIQIIEAKEALETLALFAEWANKESNLEEAGGN